MYKYYKEQRASKNQIYTQVGIFYTAFLQFHDKFNKNETLKIDSFNNKKIASVYISQNNKFILVYFKLIELVQLIKSLRIVGHRPRSIQ